MEEIELLAEFDAEVDTVVDWLVVEDDVLDIEADSVDDKVGVVVAELVSVSELERVTV